MSEVFEFPWERAAMRGDEMPEGLSLPDQLAYTALRNVYHAYYNKIISRDVATAEKNRIRHQHTTVTNTMAFQEKLCAHHVLVTRETEGAKSAFRKNPTVENGLRLCNAMDGIRLDASLSENWGEIG